MSEKQAYYENRILGEVYPDKYMSVIADGMSSNHTQFPQHQLKEFSRKCEVNLQGILEHGEEFVLIRKFQNVSKEGDIHNYFPLSII
jgi:hypothetical protein